MILNITFKKNNIIKTLFGFLLLLLVFSLVNPPSISAQADEVGPSQVAEEVLVTQDASVQGQLGDNRLYDRTIALRNLLFSFLASTTGLSSLFWLVVRGGWGL